MFNTSLWSFCLDINFLTNFEDDLQPPLIVIFICFSHDTTVVEGITATVSRLYSCLHACRLRHSACLSQIGWCWAKKQWRKSRQALSKCNALPSYYRTLVSLKPESSEMRDRCCYYAAKGYGWYCTPCQECSFQKIKWKIFCGKSPTFATVEEISVVFVLHLTSQKHKELTLMELCDINRTKELLLGCLHERSQGLNYFDYRMWGLWGNLRHSLHFSGTFLGQLVKWRGRAVQAKDTYIYTRKWHSLEPDWDKGEFLWC